MCAVDAFHVKQSKVSQTRTETNPAPLESVSFMNPGIESEGIRIHYHTGTLCFFNFITPCTYMHRNIKLKHVASYKITYTIYVSATLCNVYAAYHQCIAYRMKWYAILI